MISRRNWHGSEVQQFTAQASCFTSHQLSWCMNGGGWEPVTLQVLKSLCSKAKAAQAAERS